MLKGIHKRKRWENSGAAEIIGNILILGITVVLFSTLISFVGMMPTPEQNTYTAFSTSFGGYNSTGSPAYLNITPTGGDELQTAYTSIYVYVNSVGNQLDFSKSLTNVSGTWRIGRTLSYPLGPGTFTINPGDSIRIMIIDETRNQIVWSAQQVMGLGEGAPIFKLRWVDSDPSTPDIQSVARGDQFTIYATVMDPDDDLRTNSVYVNLSELGTGYGPLRMWDNDSDGTFEVVARTPATIPYGYFTLIFNATDAQGNVATSQYQMAVGGELAEAPNLVVLENNIDVSPVNPVRGNEGVTVTVRVTNYGKQAAAFNLVVEHRLTGSGTWAEISSPIEGEHIAGGQSLLLTLPWDADELGPSGNHTLRATATVTTMPDDSDYSDNTATAYVTILPKILLVDDDGYSDGSNMDTTRFIGAALQSCNFDYTLHRVTLQNGPGYNTGEDKMMDYDIIIWNTGHTTSPLTSTDESNIERFLNDVNGGRKLWMVGEDIVGNVSSTFLNNYLHASDASRDASPAGMYYGAANHFLEDTNFTVIERDGAPNSGDIVSPENGAFSLTEDSGGHVTSVAYSGAYKVAFFPFDFATIEHPANQTDVAYKVIKWLAGIDFIYGEDLAISQQTLSPHNPYYKQDIVITAVVRNNGYVTETTNVEFRITTSRGQITVTTDDFDIAPHASVEVNTTWEANTVGQVSIVARVDPMNIVKETNEVNNQVSTLLSSTSLYIKYRILLVDDDDSANNPGGSSSKTDVAGYMATALQDAGIDFERHNVSHQSRYGGAVPLTKYNAVIWMTGEESTYTLLSEDISNLTSFLNGGGSLWLIGQDIGADIAGSSFISGYLGVSGMDQDHAAGPVLYGSSADNMMHGLKDTVATLFTDTTDYLTPSGSAESVLWADSSRSHPVAVHNTALSSTGHRYSTLFMTVEFSFVSGSSVNGTATPGDVARAELVYRTLRGFGMPDSRIELYCTLEDLSISNAHPQLGESYVLTAQVRNMGGAASAALVRFMDGSHQVGSDSIYVQPGEVSTAEVVWNPLFAGQRTIQVLVDPIYEVDEIFRFNDNPSKNIYVYFFWDDMENGSSMWSHESTIMLINGENALDYFDKETELKTDVVQDWDTSESVGLYHNTTTYHTYDSCFQLREMGGGGASQVPMAVVITLDSSGSMDDDGKDSDGNYQPITDAQNAAKNFLNHLEDSDTSAVYDFDSSVTRTQDFTHNHEDSKAAVDGASAGGYTHLYDATIDSVEYAAQNADTDPDSPTTTSFRVAAVIILTDGVDKGSSHTLNRANQTVQAHADPDKVNSSDSSDKFVLVFTIGLGSGVDSSVLKRLATNNSCYYEAPDSSDLDHIYSEIYHTISSFAQSIGANQTRSAEVGQNVVLAGGNTNKSAVTPSFDLRHTSSAVLTFWHKYNIVPGVNGAFLEVGYNDGSGMKYRYVRPSVGPYTGNMYSGASRTDDFGHQITWAWNGASKGGNFGWEFVKLNLLNYVPDSGLSDVRVKFNYTQYGSGTGYGWYLDDVTLKVSRDETYAPDSNTKDVWQLQNWDSHSDDGGTHSWWNGNPANHGSMMAGIDNSLISIPIDLTRARTATLSAYLKFNINDESGAPPDGFRIEITKDNGVSWEAINLGARTGWGVSGSDNSGTSSYTGHNAGGNWTEAGTLTRLNCDLSEWSGNVIQIRFRVVTTNEAGYDHYDDSSAGFGGFYLDDVMITGETLST